jgi:hypothetical protein
MSDKLISIAPIIYTVDRNIGSQTEKQLSAWNKEITNRELTVQQQRNALSSLYGHHRIIALNHVIKIIFQEHYGCKILRETQLDELIVKLGIHEDAWSRKNLWKERSERIFREDFKKSIISDFESKFEELILAEESKKIRIQLCRLFVFVSPRLATDLFVVLMYEDNINVHDKWKILNLIPHIPNNQQSVIKSLFKLLSITNSKKLADGLSNCIIRVYCERLDLPIILKNLRSNVNLREVSLCILSSGSHSCHEVIPELLLLYNEGVLNTDAEIRYMINAVSISDRKEVIDFLWSVLSRNDERIRELSMAKLISSMPVNVFLEKIPRQVFLTDNLFQNLINNFEKQNIYFSQYVYISNKDINDDFFNFDFKKMEMFLSYHPGISDDIQLLKEINNFPKKMKWYQDILYLKETPWIDEILKKYTIGQNEDEISENIKRISIELVDQYRDIQNSQHFDELVRKNSIVDFTPKDLQELLKNMQPFYEAYLSKAAKLDSRPKRSIEFRKTKKQFENCLNDIIKSKQINSDSPEVQQIKSNFETYLSNHRKAMRRSNRTGNLILNLEPYWFLNSEQKYREQTLEFESLKAKVKPIIIINNPISSVPDLLEIIANRSTEIYTNHVELGKKLIMHSCIGINLDIVITCITSLNRNNGFFGHLNHFLPQIGLENCVQICEGFRKNPYSLTHLLERYYSSINTYKYFSKELMENKSFTAVMEENGKIHKANLANNL